MSPTPTTLLSIHHPMFREGYQMGRQHYFRDPNPFTDKQLVECLESLFEDSEDAGEDLYHAVGRLIGQVSGPIIPCQPYEDKIQEQQTVFLAKVKQAYGATAETLVDMIQQFWVMQDQFAQTVDADTLEQIINRGREKYRG
jgi:hypothetical protein